MTYKHVHGTFWDRPAGARLAVLAIPHLTPPPGFPHPPCPSTPLAREPQKRRRPRGTQARLARDPRDQPQRHHGESCPTVGPGRTRASPTRTIGLFVLGSRLEAAMLDLGSAGIRAMMAKYVPEAIGRNSPPSGLVRRLSSHVLSVVPEDL